MSASNVASRASQTAKLPSIYNAFQHKHRIRIISIYLQPKTDGTALRPRVGGAAQQDGIHVIEGIYKHIRKPIDNHKIWSIYLSFISPLEVFIYRATPATLKLLDQRTIMRQHDTPREFAAVHLA